MTFTANGVEVVAGLRVFSIDIQWGTVQPAPESAEDGWFPVQYDNGREAWLNGQRVSTTGRAWGANVPDPQTCSLCKKLRIDTASIGRAFRIIGGQPVCHSCVPDCTCADCATGKIPASGCALPAHEYTERDGTACWNCGATS